MAHGSDGMAWITVQTHMNVIAVASLHEMSCVIIPEGIAVEQEVLDKAAEEGIAVLGTGLDAYRICGKMAEAGIGAA
jgi:predicted transcriptional regulator